MNLTDPRSKLSKLYYKTSYKICDCSIKGISPECPTTVMRKIWEGLVKCEAQLEAIRKEVKA